MFSAQRVIMRKLTKACTCMLVMCLSPQPSAYASSSSSNPGIRFSTTELENAFEDIGKGNDNFQIHSAQKRKRNWLQLRFKGTLSFLKNPRVKSVLASSLQYAIITYLAVEIFHAAKDVYRELHEDQDIGVGDGNLNAFLTPATTKKLILWMQLPPGERGPPPSNLPPWFLSLAQHLRASHSISWHELHRILSQLSKPQAMLLQSCLLRPSKGVSFQTIGGLSAIKDSIQLWISSNCRENNDTNPSPYEEFVGQGRQGMVLWGPPGCGKSLLMQAVAKKTGWPTLVVTPSLIQSKWYGESTSKVRALFGLISLLGPCIVVLDELDGWFRVRKHDDHETSRELKTEWLQWWDGVASAQLSSNSKVFVVAATNRPWEVDPAVWRRLPQRHYVGLPTMEDRCDLVRRWGHAYHLPTIDPSVLEFLAGSTEGYTPCDLYQVLQCACRRGPMSRKDTDLTNEDIQFALQEVPPTKYSTEYIQQLKNFLAPVQQHQSQQQGSQISYTSGEPYCWQTPLGNFYHVQVPVEPAVFDLFQELYWKYDAWESSDDEDYDEESESEDDSF